MRYKESKKQTETKKISNTMNKEKCRQNETKEMYELQRTESKTDRQRKRKFMI